MLKSNAKAAVARLEAHIPAQICDQMQRTACPRGMTVAWYRIATAGEDAHRVVADAEIMCRARGDQIRFAGALINLPKPRAGCKRAAKRHAELIEPR
jgi:uncharacterized protein (DUF1778 family)